tara:strand:- start:792 stop:1175 length:384 start_codon:yes stop_codon:yes gene_type:complete
MYVPVGDITDFLDGDDFYGEMAQRFAAADSFQDRYLASAAADAIGAETQNAIDMATGALNRARDGRDGRDGLGFLSNPYVQSTIGSGIKGLFDNGNSDVVTDFTPLDLDLGITVPSEFSGSNLFSSL